ncbi:hypothetical protein D1AOALGA4SA_2999 [Olavius algarvensis Delta 1 endosymbiont]|nr:hypothetical protein D1AOALGA4SA_2999 [Olavius algarvensis Delta 1 endosymbiont]
MDLIPNNIHVGRIHEKANQLLESPGFFIKTTAPANQSVEQTARKPRVFVKAIEGRYSFRPLLTETVIRMTIIHLFL